MRLLADSRFLLTGVDSTGTLNSENSRGSIRDQCEPLIKDGF